MRRWIQSMLALTTAAVLLAGCSSKSYVETAYAASSAAPAAAYDMAMIPEADTGGWNGKESAFGMSGEVVEEEMIAEKVMADSAESAMQTSAPAVPQDRKLIKYSTMVLQTKAFDEAVDQLTALVEQAGGYIEGQVIGGRDIRESYQSERSATLNARVPVEKLDEVIGSVGGICHVVSHQQRMEDVSDTYFDSQARLTSLTLQEERLLAILSKAEKLEDVVSLERSLSEVRYEIERLTASLRRMDSQVRFSYLSIELAEVIEYQQVQDTPKTFGEQLSQAISRSISRTGNMVKNWILSAVEYGPGMLLGFIWTLFVWFVVVGAVVTVIRMVLRRFGVNNAFTRKWKKRGKIAASEQSKPDDQPESLQQPKE